MDGTIIGQGTFTQPGVAVNQIIAVPSGVDWIYTYNKTRLDTPAGTTGVKFYWQRGMPQGYAINYQNNAGATATLLTSVAAGGFTLYDPSQPALGPAVTVTAISNVVRPIVSTANTAGLVAGSIVRLSGAGLQPDLTGPDFVIDTVVANTSFRIANQLATAPGAVGVVGSYRIVNYMPLYYPRRRTIASITQAFPANVLTTVPHGYVNGQIVRFSIPAVSGMVQLDGLTGTVTVVDTNNFTVNIDTTAFTAFTYPTAAQMPATFPQVVPVGEDTAGALAFSPVPDILSDATVNTGYLGVILPAGANSPGGQANDVVYWVAGKSTYGGL